MIQKSNGSNKIGFLETDYEALAKEIQAAKDKRENKPQPETRLAKPTHGNLYKQQAQNKLNFLEDGYVPTPDKKAPETDLGSKLAGVPKSVSSHSVTNTASSTQTNEGGSQKQTNLASVNSIWDSDRLARLAQEGADSRKKTLEEKQDMRDQRKQIKQERLDRMAEALSETDQRKDAGISPLAPHSDSASEESARYRTPRAGMSIFDSADFERLAEKTAGEKLTETRKAEKNRKDDSWKNSGGATSNKDVLNRMIDGLFDNGKKE